MVPSSIEAVLPRYRPYGPVHKPGDKAPFSGTDVCDRGTILSPVRVRLSKGEEFPEAEGLSPHTQARTPAGARPTFGAGGAAVRLLMRPAP